MLQNYEIDITDFIRITNGGVVVADFVQIKSALINRYKSIYGSDIDLSTGTADGVFINDTALIINNILQSVKTLYSNLDVNTASGVYLDALCNLSNVVRKKATKSNASIIVKNESSTMQTYDNGITFVDNAGTLWLYKNSISFNPNESKVLTVVCNDEGEIKAPAGWINKTLDISYLSVVQSADANVGSKAESDSDLRARRSQSGGISGLTVLESIVGALRNIIGIDDVKIYNNNTGNNQIAKDTTVIGPHSIYVIIRKQKGITIDDSVIGKIIFEKLTPGIHTTNSAVDNKKSYVFKQDVSGVSVSQFNQTIFWKEAVPTHSAVNITITPEQFFTTDEIDIIGQTLIDYLNSIRLSNDLTTTDLLFETIYADPGFKGISTYKVKTITLPENMSNNKDSCFDYSVVKYAKAGSDITITLT